MEGAADAAGASILQCSYPESEPSLSAERIARENLEHRSEGGLNYESAVCGPGQFHHERRVDVVRKGETKLVGLPYLASRILRERKADREERRKWKANASHPPS